MPVPPVDKPGAPRSVIMFQSPREAAARAIVYRRRTRERPRERWLRVAGLVGALLVHLVFLFGAVLGSAYDWEPPSRPPLEALQVRLIDKPEPPPPPPVRGVPPRQVGPTHRGTAAAHRRVAHVVAASPGPPQPPVQVPRPDLPVISVPVPQATIKLAPVAAPRPPISLPHPQPSPALQPVPLSGEPPQITLDTPPTPQPVPPRFQPEPVRKPQLEGTRPMPSPPSLAMPELPAQTAPDITVPTIALDRSLPRSDTPASSVQLVRAVAPAAPAEPQLESVPLPAQPAPRINLQPTLSVATPSVPRERPQLQVPTIVLDQPRLAPVPSASPGPIAPPHPSAPSIDTPVVDATVTPSRPLIAPPQLSIAPASARSPDATAEAASPASTITPEAAPTPATSSVTPAAPDLVSPDRNAAAFTAEDASRAPLANPQARDHAVPGQVEGVAQGITQRPGEHTAATPAHGQGAGQGHQGKPQPGADQGQAQGRLGSYIQLKPRGDTQIMQHRAPDIGYRPTRFEGDWTPEGESALDTALRRAVEKTTVKHTFHLPRGVRVRCAVRPLFPMALFGCGNPDPPPKPVAQKVYDRLDLAPVKPLAPVAPKPASSIAATPAPLKLDNTAECVTARVSGGPLPPGCAEGQRAARPPRPAPASSSWVPASDQFH